MLATVPLKRLVTITAMLTAALGGQVYIWTLPQNRAGKHLAKRILADEFDLDGRRWKWVRGLSSTLSPREIAILQTDDYASRFYEPVGGNGAGVWVRIIFAPNNRRGIHPPETCIEGSGAEIISKGQLKLHLPTPASRTVVMKDLISLQKDGTRYYYSYVYKCGDELTPSFLRQQLAIFINSILRRGSAGALIRFETSVAVGEDINDARRRVRELAQMVLPVVLEKLP